MAISPAATEKSFEGLIETHLLEHGWSKGHRSSFDAQLGIDADELITFVGGTQPRAWDRFRERHDGDSGAAQRAFRRLVAKRLDESGPLRLLRRGIADMGIDFRLAYFRPEHCLTPNLVEGAEANRCTVVRQLSYSATDPRRSLDLVLLVNGIPTATAELKNPLTGQDVGDAMRQYREDRDPAEPLFARALVHFAVDPDLVFLTTKPAGERTRFLPFNQGSGGPGREGGAGNSPAAAGRHATAYLWEEVWEREAWLDLLARFIHIEPGGSRTIFPRYQQWDAVRRLAGDALEHGPGRNYLVQHSAGSGKSNTIAWLAHRLARLHDTEQRKVFDKVIVVSDRVVLDRQLQSTIFQFDHEPGMVAKVEGTSAQLVAALEAGAAKIIVSTLQKFPFVLERLEDRTEGRYAVIVDEAHSSQSGETARALRAALGSAAAEEADAEPDEVQDLVTRAIERSARARGPQPNLSFFAFTATPTARTLNLFGTPAAGKRVPFHLYSMRQAIEEGFILDVLRHYLPYDVLWKVASTLDDDPRVERGRATAEVAHFVSARPETLTEKARIVVEHFRSTTRAKIGGKAKALVVTASRELAVRTLFAIRDYAQQNGHRDCEPLVAFSGTVEVDGERFTEAGINGFGEKQLPGRFAAEQHRILVVAEKYLTGFDQPLLQAMYVDKRLSGPRAVQTLSRLNRVHPEKDGAFVLDFVNTTAEIAGAFAPFYERTNAEATDPSELYAADAAVRGFGVIAEEDEAEFARAFLTAGEAAHAELYASLAPARERFERLDSDEDRRELRAALTRYCDLYSFLSQAIGFRDRRLEGSFLYGRHLLRVLPRGCGEPLQITEDLILTHLRVQAGTETDASLSRQGGARLAAASAGAAAAPEPHKDPLSEIIENLNERHGKRLGARDEVIRRMTESLADDKELGDAARANPFSSFALLFDEKLDEKAVEAMERSLELFEQALADPLVRRGLRDAIGREIYRRLAAG